MIKISHRGKSVLFKTVVPVVAGTVSLFMVSSSAHESLNEGHIPANINYGFKEIGRDILEGVTDGKYTDVWSHDGYAYVGTFQDPECSTSGVFVVDIAAAIANYPDTSGATVAEIKSPPDTRVNDVKTIEVDGTTVLIPSRMNSVAA